MTSDSMGSRSCWRRRRRSSTNPIAAIWPRCDPCYTLARMSGTLAPPRVGQRIDYEGGRIIVPDDPIIPFIEGDGTGADIWRATQFVVDGTLKKIYGAKRK